MKTSASRAIWATFLSLLFTTTTFGATTIGVNFLGRDGVTTGNPAVPPLAPSEVAGVVPQPNWNNLDHHYNADFTIPIFNGANNGTSGALVDSNAVATAVTLTFAANDSWYNDVDPTTPTTPNAKLMNGIIKEGGISNSAAFTFNGIASGKYDLYVYFNVNGDNVSLDLSDGDAITTFYVTEQHQFTDTNVFVQCLNTNPAGPRDLGNYVKFSGIDTYGRSSLALLGKYVGNGDGIGIAGLQLVSAGASGVNTSPVSITAQPASRRVVAGDTNVSFSVSTMGPALSVQWYKNGAPIPGATNGPVAGISGLVASYLAPAITAGDNGATLYAVVSNNVNSVQSSNAVVTVGQLVLLPRAKQEFWDGLTRAAVEDPAFSTPPDSVVALPAFQTPTDQSDSFAVRISALFKPPVSGNYVFFLSSDDDGDLFLSTDATPANKRQIAAEPGWSSVRNWTGANGVPAGITVEQAIAQKRSDRWILDPINDPTATPPFTNGIALDAATTYYIEGVATEGGGGDNFAATFKLVGEPDPVAGDPPKLSGAVLLPYVQVLDGAFINVTNFPPGVTGVQSRTTSLSIGATSGYIGDTSGARPPISYQWQTAPTGSSTFTNIPNAEGTTYTTPVLKLTDAGTQYRVAMLAGDAATNSSIATLTVTPDTTAPRPVLVTSVNPAGTLVTLTFDETMDIPSAQTGANYVFTPGNVAGASATLAADGTTLTITAASPLTPSVTNLLTITGVKDLAGNSVAPNTTISFTFVPVTYAANILFDGPLGYYRFEETSGSVATNSGSTGGDAVYSTGDELTPREGGPPGTAKGDPGPRPPTFVGFDANNRAATFTGPLALGGTDDWVDTRNQFLQNRAAFTLEYWVSPSNRVSDPTSFGNRVAIVGQNDAIEYGFISPGTIQIWTYPPPPAAPPNGGGALDTAYTFPDNEWHHVATIASGTDIRNYFDGVLVGTGGGPTTNYGTNGIYNVHIGGGGGFDGTGNFFTGQIDEVAIFDKAIPPARVAAHYQAGKSGGVITTSGAVTPPVGAGFTLTASQSGSNLTISWTPAGGTLESTPALTGATTVWGMVGTANPTNITIGAGNSFYRVRSP
jgi:hypothetical protein